MLPKDDGWPGQFPGQGGTFARGGVPHGNGVLPRGDVLDRGGLPHENGVLARGGLLVQDSVFA